MKAEPITLRPAGSADCRIVFRWANDPETRAASFHTQTIAFDEHETWFDAAIAPRDSLFIIEAGHEPVGVARIEAADGDIAEVSINLAPTARGQGLAHTVLNALVPLASARGFRKLLARVRADNLRSQRAFEKSGFTRESVSVINGAQALVFARETAGSSDRGRLVGDK